jgi:hypothetical protein
LAGLLLSLACSVKWTLASVRASIFYAFFIPVYAVFVTGSGADGTDALWRAWEVQPIERSQSLKRLHVAWLSIKQKNTAWVSFGKIDTQAVVYVGDWNLELFPA